MSLLADAKRPSPSPGAAAPSPCRTKPAGTTTLAEIIGDAPGLAHGELLPLGSLYELLDLAAGRCAHLFVGGAVVTVSLDHGELTAPLLRGDFVQVSARVVAVGSSSLTLRVRVCKERAAVAGRGRPAFTPCFDSQLTFVAIDRETGRPRKGVPKIEAGAGEEGDAVRRVEEEVLAEKAAARERVMSAEGLRAKARDELGAGVDEFANMRECRMSIDDSLVEFRKQYLPRHENFGGIVFGALRAIFIAGF